MKLLTLLALLLCIPQAFAEENLKKVYESSIYRQYARKNMQSVEYEDDEWPCESSYYQYLKFVMQMTNNPQPFTKHQRALFIIGMGYTKNMPQTLPRKIMDGTTLDNLEILCGKGNQTIYLGSLLDRTQTDLGNAAFLYLLAQPITDIAMLKTRQQTVYTLVADEALEKQIRSAFATFKKSENFLLSLWDRQDNIYVGACNHLYIQVPLFNKLNNNALALECSTRTAQYRDALGIAGNILSIGAFGRFIVRELLNMPIFKSLIFTEELRSMDGPPIALLRKISNNSTFNKVLTLIAGFYCTLQLKNHAEWARDQLYLLNCLHKKLMHIATSINSMKNIAQIALANENLLNAIPELRSLRMLIEKPESAKMQKLLSLLNSSTFKGKKSVLFAYHGRVLQTYKLLHEIKNEFIPLLHAIGLLDAYMSTATLYKEFEDKRVRFSFAKYVQQETPLLELDDFWNPFVSDETVIANSLYFGNDAARHLIITGPNTGGKSTNLKAVALCCLLGQTIGLVPARAAVFTPFSCIITHLNITDDIGSGASLFKSEVDRAQDILRAVQERNQNEPVLIIMDELFNGTTPLEGQAAAYSFAKHIGAQSNTISLIATHFNALTALEGESAVFKNYQVDLIRNEIGAYICTYLLKPGISPHHIALELLEREGFPQEIVDAAQQALLDANKKKIFA